MMRNTYPITNKDNPDVLERLYTEDVLDALDTITARLKPATGDVPAFQRKKTISRFGVASYEVKRRDSIKASDAAITEREVFLSNEGYGYVWNFSEPQSFDRSLLARIAKGNVFYFSDISERSDAPEIIRDLREAYNQNPVEFRKGIIHNPVKLDFDRDLFDDRYTKIKFNIKLAVTNGEKMAESLEEITNKYHILEPVQK